MPGKALPPSPANIRNKMMREKILILMLLLPCLVMAVTLSVKQDGTGDYALIQEAITASADGDTVLVIPADTMTMCAHMAKPSPWPVWRFSLENGTYLTTIIDANQKRDSCY
jgi:hypothetical protein